MLPCDDYRSENEELLSTTTIVVVEAQQHPRPGEYKYSYFIYLHWDDGQQ